MKNDVSDILLLSALALVCIIFFLAGRRKFVFYMDYADLAWSASPVPVGVLLLVLSAAFKHEELGASNLTSKALIVLAGAAALYLAWMNFTRSMAQNHFLSLPWRILIAIYKVIFSAVFIPIIVVGALRVFSDKSKERDSGILFAIIGLIVGYFLVNGREVWESRGLIEHIEDSAQPAY
jgi:hypothetical protein